MGDVGAEEGHRFRINPVAFTHQLVLSSSEDLHVFDI
jgi:hypothetical protein